MKIKTLFFLFVININFTWGQQFVKIYDNTSFRGQIVELSNSDYAISGDITEGGLKKWNLTRTDLNGNVIWTKKYGNEPTGGCLGLINTSDGGFLMSGTTSPQSGGIFDAALIKTDGNGLTQWSKTYGSSSGYTQFFKSKEVVGLGYVAVGQTNSYGINILNPYAVGVNYLGDTLWTYVLNDVPGFSFGTFTDVVVNSNNDITIVGQFKGGTVVLKLDSNGNEIWKKIYYDTVTQVLSGEIQLSSNNQEYYISGRRGVFLSMFKLDTSGTVLWSNRYSLNVGSSTYQAMDVLPTNNGVLLNVNSAPGFGINRNKILKIDINGNVIFSTAHTTCDISYPSDILETNTGDIVTIGNDKGMNGNYINKSDNLGMTWFTCLDSNLIVTSFNYTLSTLISGTRSYGAIPTNPSLTENNHITEETNFNCQPDTADFNWVVFTQCTNDSTQFSSTYTTNSGFPTGFSWVFGDGNISTLQNPNHLYAAAGTYNVQLIVNWGCTADTINKSITIVSGSAPNFTYYSNPNDTICNTSVNYIAQALGADSIVFNFGDGTPNVSVSSNTLFTNHAYLFGTFYSEIISYSSCGSDTINDTITVLQPSVSNFTTNTTSFCYGQAINFTDLSVAGTLSISSWTWDFGDGTSSNIQNPSHIYTSPGAYNVTLTLSNSSGCTATNSQIITFVQDNTISIISYSAGCPCNELSFSSTGNATSWIWNFGDNTTSSIQNPNQIYSVPGQYNVSLIGTNSSGCSSKADIVIDVCPTDTLYTSKSNNNWYFYDKAGVSFSSGSPVANTMGQMASGPVFLPQFTQYASEGCATISDPNNGNLLFYANGNEVWNANHVVMPNGSGLNGSLSYSQGAVIVPMPGNTDKYFIFTSRETGDTSIYYSIVDMTLNGGLGDVEATNKNIFLTSFNGSEAMSATIKTNPQCDGTPGEYWLIIPKDSVVYEVFLIDNFGVALSGTYSFPVPTTLSTFSTMNIWGNSAFSPNGSKYVKSIISQGFLSYDFNTTTGVLSNQIYYIDANPSSNYDYEFSPNGQYLYSSGLGGVKRYDLTASDILGSFTSLSNTNTGTMWRGDDGNIYMPRNGTTFLSRINNPNLNTSTVTNNAVSLLGRATYLGLQNIVKLNIPIQDTSFASFTAVVNCLDIAFNNTSDTTNYADPCSFLANNDTLNYEWDFGDGSTSTLWSPLHSYLVNGAYQVRLIVNRPFMCTSDTTYQNVSVTSCCTSTSQFVKTYGEGEANWVEQTTDCGFVIAGFRTVNGNSESCLIRTDANGDLIWSNLYDGFYFSAVKETTDGGFAAIGISRANMGAGGGDMYLVKTDVNGVVQWSKTYGGPEQEWGSHIQPLPDGGYILVGQSFSYEQVTTPTTFFDAYLVRTNSVGDTIWTTTYHANNSWFGNGAFGVKMNAAGNFIVAGVTQTSNHQSWLAEFDYDTGNIIWSKDYDSGNYGESYIPQQLSNGNYAFAGFTQNSANGGTDFILKITDDTGNLQSSTVYGGANGDAGRDMEITSDDGYIIVGETNSYGYGGQELMLTKLNSTGAVEWTKTYGGCEDENRPSVTQTTDGGYAIAAKTTSLGSYGTTNIILIKTDPNGNSGLTCFESNPIIGTQTIALTENNGAVQIRAGIVTDINQAETIALVDTITPQCVFTADFIADTVCFNFVTTFTDSSSTDIAPCSWNWDFNDITSGVNNSSTLQNPTHTFSSAGTFNVTLTTSWMGTSESITIPVIVNPDFTTTVDTSICIGNDYTYPDGTISTNIIVNESNVSNLLTINGCDSIVTTNITILPLSYSNVNTSICQGDSVLLEGIYQTSAGNYSDTIFGGSTTGCDSIITTTLTINPIFTTLQSQSICQGDSVLIGSVFYNSAGVYDDTLSSIMGCDSIIQVTITVNSLAISNITTSICQGDSVLLGGNYQNTAGMYNDTIVNGGANGCDSIVTTTLSILSLPFSSISTSICQGDSILIGGSYQSTAGTYTDTISNGGSNGCDSIVNTTLTINPIAFNTINLSICEGDSVLINGNYEFISGTYNDTISNGSANGCDSIVSTVLTVTPMADATINSTDNTYCLNDNSVTFTANNSGGTWSGNGITDTANGIFSPSSAGVGNHQIVYNIAGSCGDADSINIDIYANPTISFTTTDDNCGQAIGLIEVAVETGINPIIFNWDTGETTQNLTDLTEGGYTIVVTDSSGCNISEQITVSDLQTDCEYHIYLPNAFTPNGDGENDILFLRGKGIESFTLVIYNRWGNKVFETSDLSYGWDGIYKGNILNPAVFVYVVEVTFDNGEKATDKGNVSIIK